MRLLRQERAKKERQLAQDQVSLAQTTRVMGPEFPANSREQAKLLLREQGLLVLLVAVNPPSPRLRRASWTEPAVRCLAAEEQPELATLRSPALPVRQE